MNLISVTVLKAGFDHGPSPDPEFVTLLLRPAEEPLILGSVIFHALGEKHLVMPVENPSIEEITSDPCLPVVLAFSSG
jgi:hypothetical protein